METLDQLQGIAVKPRPPAPNASTRQLRLVAVDKNELDQMIQSEQRRGWKLISRSFSLDDGHGALLFLNGMNTVG